MPVRTLHASLISRVLAIAQERTVTQTKTCLHLRSKEYRLGKEAGPTLFGLWLINPTETEAESKTGEFISSLTLTTPCSLHVAITTCTTKKSAISLFCLRHSETKQIQSRIKIDSNLVCQLAKRPTNIIQGGGVALRSPLPQIEKCKSVKTQQKQSY